MKKIRSLSCILFFFLTVHWAAAQNGEEVFTFLRYPTSARVNALGGNNVSLVENDPSLVFHNPALAGAEMDGMVNLNYMNFVSDIHLGSALYTKALGETGAWGIGANFISYGNFKQTTAEKLIEGEFSVEDVSLNTFYSRNLSEKWRGGIALKFLYSSLESYSSIGLAVDAGLSYYDSEKEFSAGIVLKHVGAQLKPYYDKRQKLPWDIQLGLSKRMAHAPFRLSLTAMYLNTWDDASFQTLIKHLVVGVDFIPSENFWLGLGFNPKTNADMKLQNGNGLGGFSAGGGVKIKAFDVGVSVARYHPSALSLMLSLSTAL
ncbi:MAG: type IX secretion system protein PorQ [Tannerellaceae bacterium]|nr:type IX secretion system protein PorQ [Tannerellaceae bacterium]